MRRFLKWGAFVIGAVWLLWAMLGDAPGERGSGLLCQDALLRRREYISKLPADADWATLSSSVAWSTATKWESDNELPTDLVGLSETQAYGIAYDVYQVVWRHNSIAKDVQRLRTVANLTADVERYCG